jgi:cytochrome c oxidase assembly factor CtaG
MLPAFGWQAVITQWEFAPVVTATVAVAGALYLWGAWRVGRRHPARPWPRWRTAAFLGGLGVVVFATQSGIGAYDDVLIWDHMIQHLMLIMIAPPMLVVGQPLTLLLHASRNPLHAWAKRVIRSRALRFLTWPLFGLLAYIATIVGTHLTGLAHEVLVNEALHNAEHALYLVVGYLYFLPLLGQEPIHWRVPYPLRIILLVVGMPVDTFTGLVLGYAGRWYTGTLAGPRPPGSPGLVEDAHWAGATMWIGGDAIMLIFIMVVFWMWSRDDRAALLGLGWLEAARKANFDELVARHPVKDKAAALDAGVPGTGAPGAGTPGAGTPGADAREPAGIDDDEHLAAYNAYLAQLNRSAARNDRPAP